MIEEETRGKLAAQAKARQEQDEKEMLKERLEEEEENKATFEKQIQDLQAKVKPLFTTGKSLTLFDAWYCVGFTCPLHMVYERK